MCGYSMGRNNNKGWILLEAVVVVVIVAIALTSISQSFAVAARAAGHDQERTKALLLLENQLQVGFWQGLAEGGERDCPKPYGRFQCLMRAVSSPEGSPSQVQSVRVSVRWPFRKGSSEVMASALLENKDAYAQDPLYP